MVFSGETAAFNEALLTFTEDAVALNEDLFFPTREAVEVFHKFASGFSGVLLRPLFFLFFTEETMELSDAPIDAFHPLSFGISG